MDEHVGFWSKPSVKSCDNNKRWLVLEKYCDLLDFIRAKWLEIDKKFVPVRVTLREDLWGRRHRGGSAPTEVDISDGERRLIDISSVSTSGVWVWVARIDTVIDIATLRWCSDSSEDRSLRSCESSTACIRSLAKLSLVTFLVPEPDCIIVELTDWLYDRYYYITENIEKIIWRVSDHY